VANPIKFEGTKLGELVRRTANLTPALKVIGLNQVKVTVRGWQQQGRGTQWAPRRVPNIAGALSDLAKSGTIKARRFSPRPALVDTGALRQSISYALRGKKSITFGSNLAYANRMQEGGASTFQISPTVRKNLANWLRKNKGQRANFGWIFNAGGEVTVTARARPFAKFLPADAAFVRSTLSQFFRGKL
jgi:phage gpG-like protein